MSQLLLQLSIASPRLATSRLLPIYQKRTYDPTTIAPIAHKFLWLVLSLLKTELKHNLFQLCTGAPKSIAQNAFCSWDIYLQSSYNHRSVILPVLLQLSALDWLMITCAFFHWEYLLLIKVQEVEQRDNTYVRHC